MTETLLFFAEFEITEHDISFICKLILGCHSKSPVSLLGFLNWNKTDYERLYMFQILANESDDKFINGVDVDKFDYLKRDCHNIGITTGFDPQRLMQFAYIDTNDHRLPLKYSVKGHEMIQEMWDARTALHRRAYQHRVVKCYDAMVLEVFKQAGNNFYVYTSKGEKVLLSKIHNNLDAYIEVTDHILTEIRHTTQPELAPARRILQKISCHKHWNTILTVISRNKIEDPTLVGVSIINCEINNQHVKYIYQKSEIDKIKLMELIKKLHNNQDCLSVEIKVDLQ